MESSFLNDCQWLEVSLNLAPWETGDNREPGRKMYPPLSSSWREGCAGFTGHLGAFYARILGSKYPEHDLEGGCKVNGLGSWGATRVTRMGCPFGSLDIWLPWRPTMLVPVLLSLWGGRWPVKGQSEVSRYTENASPKDAAQSPTDTFRKEKKKKKKT